jgi:DNA modification methylase
MSEIKPIEYWLNKIHCGDAYELLKQIPSESVDCVITSPPYFSHRKYNTERIFDGDPNCSHEWNEYIKPKERGSYGESSWHRPSRDNEPKWNSQVSHFCVKCNAIKCELGLEPDYRLYVKHLVDLFREVKRILKKTGSFWLNLGDTYAGSHSGRHDSTLFQNPKRKHIAEQIYDKPTPQAYADLPPKCLMLIPMRVALALIDDGWILRNVIIWSKPNSLPESVKDRLSNKFEYIFHFVKSRKYYYQLDYIRISHKTESIERYERALRQVESGNPKLHKKVLEDGKVVSVMVPKELTSNLISTNSKFLKTDIKTASPGARAVRTLLSGKLTTHVKKKLLDVGAYLKAKLKESGLNIKQLSEITGIKKTTLEHYFRTDFSGQALPDRETWNILKPILNLGNYDDYISEEIRSALPQLHPFGKNPGNIWEINTRPLKEAHYAPFPPELPLRPILATCPPDNGIVLDPLAGSGTTALTCELINHGKWDEFRIPVNDIAKKQKWNIKWIMIEMNPEYCKIAQKCLEPFLTQDSLVRFI